MSHVSAMFGLVNQRLIQFTKGGSLGRHPVSKDEGFLGFEKRVLVLMRRREGSIMPCQKEDE